MRGENFMQVKNLKIRNIRKFEELLLESGTFNTEALMLLMDGNSFPDHTPRVFKYMDLQDDHYLMSKKDFTLTTLDSLEEYRAIDSLVIPDYRILIDNALVGFAMRYIEDHKNLGKILNDRGLPLDLKIPYLKQIGKVLADIQSVHRSDYRLQLADLNEYNFILDKEGRVKTIDLDSSYLGVGEPITKIYYLLQNPYVRVMPEKYEVTKMGAVLPTDNTDIYCYLMILLKVLSHRDFSTQPISVFYDYLTYLSKLGVSNDVIFALKSLYQSSNNINPYEVLEGIPCERENQFLFHEFEKTYYK